MPDTSANPIGTPKRTVITLIRHGESEVTVDQIIGGFRTCRGLSPLGRSQTERLRERLLRNDDLVADALISSDFPRAIETAEILRPVFDDRAATGEIEQWPDFGEQDPGPEIDGMSFDAYAERFGTPDWSGDPDANIFPGGETTTRFHERVERGLTTLITRFDACHVMVACHGGVVDAALRIVLGLPRTGGFELHTLNTAITTFSRPPTQPNASRTLEPRSPWRLVTYNDAGHLVGLPAATPRRMQARQ